MARYVDVDELRAGVDATNWYHIRDGRLVSGARNDLEPLYKAADIVELVDLLEPADVAPVVHAHWILYDDNKDIWDCSQCKNHVFVDVLFCKGNYCPNCGAKMDEEANT